MKRVKVMLAQDFYFNNTTIIILNGALINLIIQVEIHTNPTFGIPKTAATSEFESVDPGKKVYIYICTFEPICCIYLVW
jgi:hypothetical protein